MPPTSTIFLSNSQLPSITVPSFDGMSSSKDNSHLSKDPAHGLSKKYRDLTLTETFQVRYAIPLPPDKRLLQNASLKVKCGDYEWNVHDELLWTESGYVKQNSKVRFVLGRNLSPGSRMLTFHDRRISSTSASSSQSSLLA
jgi:hypothetical protein